MKRFVFAVFIIVLLTGCNGSELEGEIENERAVESVFHIHDLAFDREEEATLYVGTHHGVLKVKLDEGMQWQGDINERHDFMGLSITPDNRLISSGHPDKRSGMKNPLGVLVSDTKGETWETHSLYGEVDFHLIEVNEFNSDVIYGLDSLDAKIYQSTDAGLTWTIMDGNVQIDPNHWFVFISNSLDPYHLLGSFRDGLYESKDGGQEWVPLNRNLGMVAVDHLDQETLLAYGIGGIEGLMTSTDFGATWEPFETEPIQGQIVSIAVHSSNRDVIAVGTMDDSIYITTDGGHSWNAVVQKGKPNL
ncbi:WD40/YVTN/BNR-like repeat-containing protein [Bacillus alkalicellulosilyticus]|uniref:WD40/YVTN/BNR-like repeat-containing protein n=1 Tax=Alkalihalobacterium alkalicellulosilyticum TaxID=1912214 RepID=UPI0009962A8F|nr:YCF48-related protein [Bacillus alkalicellulosilyticus]